jgi:hypothetical protein
MQSEDNIYRIRKKHILLACMVKQTYFLRVAVGTAVRDPVGAFVGDPVGAFVVGAFVGDPVGAFMGDDVRTFMGDAVGALIQQDFLEGLTGEDSLPPHGWHLASLPF